MYHQLEKSIAATPADTSLETPRGIAAQVDSSVPLRTAPLPTAARLPRSQCHESNQETGDAVRTAEAARATAPAVHPAPAAPVPDGRAVPADEGKRGFGWLMRGQRPRVAPLAELLQSDGAQAQGRFLCAVASELCVDAPEGCFTSVPGLTSVPTTVPKSARTALLHAAVKAEAEDLKHVERAELITRTGKSMVLRLVDRASALKSKEESIAALDNLVGFVGNIEQLCEELAPDVEADKVTYEGQLRYKSLEDLYSTYLDTSVQEVQQQTTLMLSSWMGGSDAGDSGAGMEEMQARIDQCDKNRQILASILKISEGKAERLMQKKMSAVAEEAQKEMLQGLQSMT